MPSELSANMRATSEAFVTAFDGTWRPGATMDLRAPDCEHTMLPSSLGIGKKNNDEWAAHFKKFDGVVTEAKMTLHDYLAVPDELRSVCWSSITATTPVGPYSNEYVWFFTFDESGKKVKSITEFLDSKAAGEVSSKLVDAGIVKRH